MKLLLDTHTFIWWHSAPDKLPPSVLSACQNDGNTIHLSLASVWEMQIKQQLGKLDLREGLEQIISHQIRRNGLLMESPTLSDIYSLSQLPSHHQDPFDRILVAQARLGGFALVTRDPLLAAYDVAILW